LPFSASPLRLPNYPFRCIKSMQKCEKIDGIGSTQQRGVHAAGSCQASLNGKV